MSDKKCKACGATYHKNDEFYKCEKCGDIYCHNCAHFYSEQERKISESAKKGDRDSYVRAVCPTCKTDMYTL